MTYRQQKRTWSTCLQMPICVPFTQNEWHLCRRISSWHGVSVGLRRIYSKCKRLWLAWARPQHTTVVLQSCLFCHMAADILLYWTCMRQKTCQYCKNLLTTEFTAKYVFADYLENSVNFPLICFWWNYSSYYVSATIRRCWRHCVFVSSVWRCVHVSIRTSAVLFFDIYDMHWWILTKVLSKMNWLG